MSDFDATHVDSIDGVIGNRASVDYLIKFATDTDRGAKRKPLMMHGPCGTGKTLAAHMIAKRMGWNLIEMSSSDYRDAGSIAKRLHVSSNTRSLFGKTNMILLDEIDELSGRHDEGAASAINKLINESKSPVVMIANNMWAQGISFLRGKTDNIEFKKLTALDISRILDNAAKKMNVKVSALIIESIASRSSGDARSALNDMLVMVGSDEEMLDSIGLRDRKSDIFSVLDKIFASHTVSAPLRAIAVSDVDNDMMIKWVDENLPYRYMQMDELRAAYASLANATKFSARASRKQYYTYWRYMNVMMSSGVALAKDGTPDTRRRYSFPKVISELSSSKADRNTETMLAKKLQKRVHHSLREIKLSILPLMSAMVKKALVESDKETVYDFFAAKFDMTSKEVDSMVSVRASRRVP
jgi:replication factor C large subunit